jgi:hypothetical protein
MCTPRDDGQLGAKGPTMKTRTQGELAELIATERRHRGWSVRRAAAEGGVSNQLWGQVEQGQTRLGHKMHRAVMQAFNWPETWQSDAVVVDVDTAAAVDDLLVRVRRLEENEPPVITRLDVLESRLEELIGLLGDAARGQVAAVNRRRGGAAKPTPLVPSSI